MKLNRCILLFIAAFMHLASGAVPPALVPRLTGEQFLALYFGGHDISRMPKTPKRLVDQERALGYLAGVADATQGKGWCDKSRVKTIEIDAELAHAMRKLSAEELKQDAAFIIVGMLRERYPCQ